jgi:carboxymethylenebutenolidase
MGQWLSVGPHENRAYLALPAGGNGPGVLVLHAWWGLTGTFTGTCDWLAAAGFVALAPSLYEDDATATTIPEAEALIANHDSDPGRAWSVIAAAIDLLRSRPETAGGNGIGIVGFSMGSWWAFKASEERQDDVKAVVGVYGAYDDGDFAGATAAYQGHFGENDDFEPLDGVRALETTIREAGREVEFHIYPGAGHWFAEEDRPDAYDADAAALFRERTVDFLRNHLPA